MNKLKLSVAGLLIALAAWFVGGTANLGGVRTGDAYVATTTRSTSESATVSYLVCGGSGTFGSIVVVQPATAGYVRVWNATSTATSTYNSTDVATTATFGVSLAQVLSASDVVGTLVFDSAYTKGLVVETSMAFNGEYVVTCKQ